MIKVRLDWNLGPNYDACENPYIQPYFKTYIRFCICNDLPENDKIGTLLEIDSELHRLCLSLRASIPVLFIYFNKKQQTLRLLDID